MARKDNDNGYIMVYRKILNNEIWRSEEPFDKRSAWIDLLLLTQHTEYKGTARGSYKTSQMWLANRWKWSRNKVSRFLGQLMEQGCVAINSSTNGATRGTTITIVNYGKFQGERATDGATNGTTKRATKRATNGAQTINDITSNASTSNDVTTIDPASLWDPQGRVYE